MEINQTSSLSLGDEPFHKLTVRTFLTVPGASSGVPPFDGFREGEQRRTVRAKREQAAKRSVPVEGG
jgi:hypothetical protein